MPVDPPSDTTSRLVVEPRWLAWARELQAIAQTGLHYSEIEYDRERYQAVERIAAEMMACQSGHELRPVLDLFRHDTGYATPKVDVRGIVFRDGKILLVKEKLDGKWTPPGGWADVNEAPSEAVVREVWEESGFETRIVKLLAVYDRTKQGHQPYYPFHVYKIFFLCEVTGGEAAVSSETDGVGFFPPVDLPELSTSRISARQIARFFELLHHPEWPADFD
ncbi:MAG: NUDIX hydrolase [bacterium]|nr:NUDIX hydrolase [Candidatus Sumerlaeota bacterium]